MSDPVDKVSRLIALAVNASAAPEEARNAALAACKLIVASNLRITSGASSSEAASPPRAASPRPRSASRERPSPPPPPASPFSEATDWDGFMKDFFATYDWSKESPRRRVKVRSKCVCTYCSAEIASGEYAYDLPRTADRICSSCHDEGVGDDLESEVL